jgi:hypothetical protein
MLILDNEAHQDWNCKRVGEPGARPRTSLTELATAKGLEECRDLPACDWTVAAWRTMCLNLPPAAEAGDWMETKVKVRSAPDGELRS